MERVTPEGDEDVTHAGRSRCRYTMPFYAQQVNREGAAAVGIGRRGNGMSELALMPGSCVRRDVMKRRLNTRDSEV